MPKPHSAGVTTTWFCWNVDLLTCLKCVDGLMISFTLIKEHIVEHIHCVLEYSSCTGAYGKGGMLARMVKNVLIHLFNHDIKPERVWSSVLRHFCSLYSPQSEGDCSACLHAHAHAALLAQSVFLKKSKVINVCQSTGVGVCLLLTAASAGKACPAPPSHVSLKAHT